jgi:beta-phosphoglucomutase-like phosphatase (HAD superfamily)/dTDP-glucose pyrophosphorylase
MTHILFDLDGVLVDYKELHRDAFIQAWNTLCPDHSIDAIFHAEHLEARSTRQKLALLQEKLSPDAPIAAVSALKQEITQRLLATAPVFAATRASLQWAHDAGIPISCCSNSIRATVEASLQKLAPLEWFSCILSNEDVTSPKPDPEIYDTALQHLGISAEDALVLEDSVVGKAAARAAGLNVIDVVDPLDITPSYLRLLTEHRCLKPAPLYNLVIPMAGLGSRFQVAGYTTPKPFLPVAGMPMFEQVLRNVIPPALFDLVSIHLILREETVGLFQEAPAQFRNLHLHTVPALTEGAACTVLSVESIINTDAPLVIANSDQFLEWDAANFFRCLTHPDWQGVISTFYQPDARDLRWSYAATNSDGEVTRVEEKQYIGPLATTGIYGWARGSDFVRDARAMIAQNIRVKGEFYVCPVYNTGVERGLRIRTLNCHRMWGLGVPEDYEFFLANYKPTTCQ